MTFEQLLLTINGVLVTIVGYFLIKTMDNLKSTSDLAISTKNKLDILENDHINKHESLSADMKRLTRAIDANTKAMEDFRTFVFEKLSN